MSARLEEAYSIDFVHKNVLYRTCGHNKLCHYGGCLKCLQVNKFILNLRLFNKFLHEHAANLVDAC